MGPQVDRNAGITGILDLPGLSAKFPIALKSPGSWQRSLSSTLISCAGRGDGSFPEQRPLASTGKIVVVGQFSPEPAAWPVPTTFIGTLGSLVIRYGTSPTGVAMTETVSVRVISHTPSRDIAKQDLPILEIALQVLSMPTLAGWTGSQPTVSAETFTDKELWTSEAGGMLKGVDPSVIQDSARQRILVWGIGDNDAAEMTKIGTLISGATDPTSQGLKLRPTAFTRISANACYMDFTWGRTSTVDDIQNPKSPKVTDSSTVTSTADVCLVQTSSVLSAPTVTGYVYRNATTTKIHDTRWDVTYHYGMRTPDEDVTMPETVTTPDANTIASKATVCVFDTSATAGSPPAVSGMVYRGTVSTTQLNEFRWKHVFDYGLRTTADDETMPATQTTADPLAVESNAAIAEIYATSGGEPINPGAPLTELQLVAKKVQELNQTESKRIAMFDVLNSEQKRSYPLISTTDDAYNIADAAVRVKFWAVGGSAPAAPDDPPANDVEMVNTEDKPITPAINMRVFTYGARNTRDQAVLREYETNDDASVLQSTASRSCLDGESITDPPGYVLRFTKTIPLSLGLGTNRTLTVKVYGLRTTEQDITFPGTVPELDKGVIALQDKGKVTVVTASGTPPADPGGPGASKLVYVSSQQQTGGKWAHTFLYDWRSPQDELELGSPFRPHNYTIDDPSLLELAAEVAILDATPPSTVTVNGIALVPVQKWSHPVKRDAAGATLNTLNRWRYAPMSNADRIVYRGSMADDSPLIGFKRSAASIQAVSTNINDLADSLYSANKSDVTFDSVIVQQLTPGKARAVVRTSKAIKWWMRGNPRRTEVALAGEPDPTSGGFGLDLVRVQIERREPFFLVSSWIYNAAIVKPIVRPRIRADFIVRRRFVGDAAAAQTNLLVSQWGTVNNATFLGFAKDYLMLIGASINYDLSDTAAHLMVIDYHVAYDDMQWYSDRNLSVGYCKCYVAAINITGRYIDPASYFDPAMVAAWPAESDLSAITT